MSATVLSGSELAKTMRTEIELEVTDFMNQHGFSPTAAVVRAGEDPASISYSNALEKTFGARGMGFQLHTLPETASQDEIVALVAKLNADKTVHGIMVQEPLPKGIDEAAVKDAIDQGAPLENFSIDTVGLTAGVPDENVRIARRTAMTYGKINPS